MSRKLQAIEERSIYRDVCYAYWGRNNARYLSPDLELAQLIGLDEATLLGVLISYAVYFTDERTMRMDGYFFFTVDKLEKETTLSGYQQAKAIKKLARLGLITVKYGGNPRKRYIHVVDDPTNLKLLLPEIENKKPRKRRQSEETEDLSTQ